MKKYISLALIYAILITLSVSSCNKRLENNVSHEISGQTINASDIPLLTDEVVAKIEEEKSHLEILKDEICLQVANIAQVVTPTGDGSLTYPNWVRFVEIAEAIDSLNDNWNEAYGQALDNIINTTNIDPNDEAGQEAFSDMLEEDYLIFPADMASECFENMFSFESLRMCLETSEDDWLENSIEFNPANAPTIQEPIEDEEYWTLITCDRRYVISNTTVDEDMMEGREDSKIKELLGVIQDIVGVLGGGVNIVREISSLLEDCAGSTTTTERDVRDGITIPNETDKWIGYVMKQKGVLFDFNQTQTKIKGKAKIWKLNSKGKRKKDRKNKASIDFCVKEWNNCDGGDWVYKSPVSSKRKKVKIKFYQPYALVVGNPTHYLQFGFGRNGIYATSLNLLGTTGCRNSSNTDW